MSSSAAVTATAASTGTRTLDVTLKLPQLQNLCKRDPAGYREDYDAQCRRLTAELQVRQLQQHGSSSSSNGGGDHRVVELIQFTAAVSSSSYKGAESDRVARQLQGLLTTTDGSSGSSVNAATATATSSSISSSNSNLPKDVRKACVSALILMRNKGAVAPLDLLPLFFNLMVVTADKALRELLYRHMVNDIRNINKKGKRDDKVNRSVQTFLHKTVQSCNDAGAAAAASSNNNHPHQEMAAKRAVDMVCELYRRRVWTDERTVAILASAVQSPVLTVASRAMRFFLNIEEKMAHDERVQQEEQLQETNRAVDYHLHSKKTCKRQRQTQRALKNKERAAKRRHEGGDWLEEGEEHPENDKGVEGSKKLYPAIELLRDPQGLAEAVFRRLRSGNNMKFESKMLMINFVTRLTGNHELLLLPLYSFLQKYLGGHQRDVTAILAYTVQACHEQVPPDEIYGLLKTVAHNFITERCSEEQMAVGINAVRAIVVRVPSVLNNSSDNDDNDLTTASATDNHTAVAMDMEAFARDLAAYANHRDRSVAVAGKAWTNFVRQTHPGLLQGKDRGLQGSALYRAGVGGRPARYGERRDVATGVEGADLLVEYESKKRRAVAKKKMQQQPKDVPGDEEDDEVVEEEDGGSEDGSGEWQDVVHSDNDDGDDGGEEEEDDEGEEQAPQLVCLDGESTGAAQLKKDNSGDEEEEEEATIDLSKMSVEERNKLKQQVSSTRVFTTAEFVKMRKLVEREERAKRDPREAARRKRAIARGEEFEALSGSDSDDSDEEEDEVLQIKGAVNPADIMALASRKRQSKADKLEKILAGRSKFESKQREGGSTNIEKTRKKNFLMSKFSKDARRKGRGKGGLQKKKREMAMTGTHQAKKKKEDVVTAVYE